MKRKKKIEKNGKNERFILEAEKRFKKTSNISEDISFYPALHNVSNIETNKAKSKEFSEVFTPLWLVDQMIDQVKWKSPTTTTLDLCAGYGQFSIRLMRFFQETYPDFSISDFIKETHAFSELQLSSCYKLLNIFGNKITLFIGDSTYLGKLPVEARGIWCYIESYGYWVCLTKTISDILSPNGIKEKPVSEAKFVSSVETIVKGINETYTKIKDMHNLTLKQMTSPKLRLELISQINSATADSALQSVDTPQSVIADMLACVDDLEKKSILVLFNCEIVEQLISKKKIDPKNITFAADFGSTLKSKTMQKMYGVEIMSLDFKSPLFHAQFKSRKFDVCLSNPPYNDHIHLKILMSLFQASIAKEYVIVHPSNWLLDQKESSQLFINFKNAVSQTMKECYLFNGNPIFNISLHHPCMITHIDVTHNGKIAVSYFGEKYMVDDIYQITKYGKNWETIVSPMFSNVKKHIAIYGNVWNRNVKKTIPNKSYCQLAAIRGHEGYEESSMVKDDFYTMVLKKSDECKGIRKSMDKRPGPTFEFSSSSERDSFIDYLKTDFARFCLSYYKSSQNLFYGEMAMIPWLDFTQSWDDEKLFKHFDINQETQDYIRKFLPDYYGIRKQDGNQTKTSGLPASDLQTAV